MWLLLIFVAQINVTNSNNISCVGSYTCSNGEYQCNQNEDCHITCSGGGACERSTFVCPYDSYDCIITVDGNPGANVMKHSFINGTLMDGGNLLLHIGPKTIAAMQYSSIYCPTNGDCNITHVSREAYQYALRGSNIVAQPTTNLLYIKVSSSHALSDAYVLCPETNACIIHAIGSGETMIRNLHIYSVESFNNVRLICNYSTSVTSNCYYINTPPVMHCTESFVSSCQLHLVNGTYNNFHCIDNHSQCSGGYEKNTTIYNNIHSIFCWGYEICSSAVLYCVADKDCYVYCHHAFSCVSSTIFCPIGEHDCIITVDGGNAFRYGTIDASFIDGGNLLIHAFESSFRSAVVKCPHNGDCNVTGTGGSVLHRFRIIAQPTTKIVHIKAIGSSALSDAVVQCGNTLCIIHITDGTYAISRLRIYSLKSLSNVQLICEGHCVLQDYGMPTIYCTEYYQSSCKLNFTNVYDQVVCIDENSPCTQNNITINNNS
eukprot:95344_1